jgi:pimeloyl-ACP methyl ester carboxylesterase
MEPKTKYARNGDVFIAYRVFGDGPRDLILVPGTVSHVELFWELPANEYLLKRLSSFARVIVFDKRGQGLSDRVAEQSIEERVDDLRAVMHAVGSERATIYGWSEGGPMSLTFAANHPERTAGLVLYGTYPSIKSEPWSLPPERYARFLSWLAEHWGEGILVKINAPSRINDEAFVQWFGRLERAVASPGAILALMRANYENDVSPLLSSIRVPTLILHRQGDALIPVQAGRYLAWHIPGARYFELPGGDHLLQAFDLDVLDMLVDRIEEFVTGFCPRRGPQEILAGPRAVESLSLREDAQADRSQTASESLLEAIAELERCRETIASGGDTAEIEGLVARAQALISSASGSWQDSESQFVTAISNFRRHKMAWQEARTFQIWERSLVAGVDRRGLIEKLDTTIETFRRRFAAISPTPSGGNGHVTNGHGNRARGVESKPLQVPSPAVFQREGDYWTVSFRGNLVRLKDSKGLHYISYLMVNAGRQVPACELAVAGKSAQAGQSTIEAGRAVASLGDAGSVLDAKARQRYQRRIAELREELAEAEKLNDTGRATRVRWELEYLGDQIAAAVGLRGRGRTAASHRERARLMVTKAIKAAIAKIHASNAALGHHLATCVKTGNFCTYDPGPQHFAWRL